jgi:hypothetical protein
MLFVSATLVLRFLFLIRVEMMALELVRKVGERAKIVVVLHELFAFFGRHSSPLVAEMIFAESAGKSSAMSAKPAKKYAGQDKQTQSLPKADGVEAKDVGKEGIPQQHDRCAKGSYGDQGAKYEFHNV